MGAGHSHGTGTGVHRNRLLAVLGVTLTVLVAEVIGGLISGSLALLAHAGHMLTDAAGIGLALLAAAFAARPATPERSFGYQRAEVLSADDPARVGLLSGDHADDRDRLTPVAVRVAGPGRFNRLSP